METFSALLAICAGNSPASGEFPVQRPVTRNFDVFFDLCPNQRLRNNREAGDLRRYHAHYDVIVMCRRIEHGYVNIDVINVSAVPLPVKFQNDLTNLSLHFAASRDQTGKYSVVG